MTREEGVRQMEALQRNHYKSLIKGMDGIARALSKNDIAEVKAIVGRARDSAVEIQKKATEIIGEVREHEKKTEKEEP